MMLQDNLPTGYAYLSDYILKFTEHIFDRKSFIKQSSYDVFTICVSNSDLNNKTIAYIHDTPLTRSEYRDYHNCYASVELMIDHYYYYHNIFKNFFSTKVNLDKIINNVLAGYTQSKLIELDEAGEYKFTQRAMGESYYYFRKDLKRFNNNIIESLNIRFKAFIAIYYIKQLFINKITSSYIITADQIKAIPPTLWANIGNDRFLYRIQKGSLIDTEDESKIRLMENGKLVDYHGYTIVKNDNLDKIEGVVKLLKEGVSFQNLPYFIQKNSKKLEEIKRYIKDKLDYYPPWLELQIRAIVELNITNNEKSQQEYKELRAWILKQDELLKLMKLDKEGLENEIKKEKIGEKVITKILDLTMLRKLLASSITRKSKK